MVVCIYIYICIYVIHMYVCIHIYIYMYKHIYTNHITTHACSMLKKQDREASKVSLRAPRIVVRHSMLRDNVKYVCNTQCLHLLHAMYGISLSLSLCIYIHICIYVSICLSRYIYIYMYIYTL